jgi:hypothetical protein
MSHKTRRRFIQELGLSSASLPLLMGLPSVASAATPRVRATAAPPTTLLITAIIVAAVK